jgi:hypothetical protein
VPTHKVTQIKNARDDKALDEFFERAIVGEPAAIQIGKTIVTIDFGGADYGTEEAMNDPNNYCDLCGDYHPDLDYCPDDDSPIGH